jgi:peptidoglycan/LPS O-acetylase OafA/YrhL
MAAKRSIQYIPAIDGLRALAVIAVMFYHLGFSWIPGGFLGVDLFFVISGYVITRMLLDSIAQSGGLDLRGFYLARLRRLLPALLFMLTTTVIAVGIWAPDTIKRLLVDTPFALTGTINWWLVANEQDYFESIGRPPLLQHTWSLAVEAQFYLIWPLILYFILKKFGKKHIPVAALSIAAASGIALLLVSFSIDAANASKVSHVYFGTDTHSIGLFLGAALAVSWIPQISQRSEFHRWYRRHWIHRNLGNIPLYRCIESSDVQNCLSSGRHFWRGHHRLDCSPSFQVRTSFAEQGLALDR